MQTPARNPLPSRAGKLQAGMRSKILAWAALALAAMGLQGCSGSSHPNYQTSTSNNPAPGVSLESIQISPSTPLIAIAENRQLTAIGTYNNGAIQDLTSQVTWAASSTPSTTNYVSVSSHGVATGVGVGATVITASLGPVTGLLQVLGYTNGLTSNTVGILAVPYKSTVVDAAYLPVSQTKIQGSYAVQEVNLDADQFSNVLPVELALLASVPMPAGFVPNATIASQANNLVAVISYTSPSVQIIDATNLSSDLTNNTVIATYAAPITQTVTINGTECMICAAVVNPLNGELLMSTSQGYYNMNLTTGAFTGPLPFTPAPAPAQNFSLNPLVASPYILAPNAATGEVQILNLTTNAVTTFNSAATGLSAPNAAVIDPVSDFGAFVDADTNSQSLVTASNPQSPTFTPLTGIGASGVCGSPPVLNMVTMGISANPVPQNAQHTLFTSQTSGSCVGLENPWPTLPSSPLDPTVLIGYYYGPMPTTPDGNAFVNGNDPNAITTFNSVVDQHNYGVLVDANQQWIAKLNLPKIVSDTLNGSSLANLPGGELLPSSILCSTAVNCFAPSQIVFLPTPSSAVTISVNSIGFGNLSVGTASPPLPAILADIGQTQVSPQITVQGTNPGDFLVTNTCSNILLPESSCSISAVFTPTATGARSAVVSITYSGGSPLTVQLSGTGT